MSTILRLLKEGSPDDTSNRKRLMRDTAVEFLATSMFVWMGCLGAVSTGTKLVGQGVSEDVARVLPIAMCFGIGIMTLAYSIGHLTGGHMNPGVSFMMLLQGEMSVTKMTCYWIAQFLGALLGASLVWGCTSQLADGDNFTRPPLDLGATMLDSSISTGNGFLVEFLGSFFFYFVISQTALDKRGVAESFFPPIPIGFSLVIVHICLIPFTGCGVNPARTFGPSMVVCMSETCDNVVGSWYWIYYVGPFAASWAVAEVTLLMKWQVDDEEDADSKQLEEENEVGVEEAEVEVGDDRNE